VKVTCLLARIPKGEMIPEHTHKVHDILYPLSGKAKIWKFTTFSAMLSYEENKNGISSGFWSNQPSNFFRVQFTHMHKDSRMI